MADDAEELVQQVLQENPVEEVGLRDEWKQHEGWHRKENVRGGRNNQKDGGGSIANLRRRQSTLLRSQSTRHKRNALDDRPDHRSTESGSHKNELRDNHPDFGGSTESPDQGDVELSTGHAATLILRHITAVPLALCAAATATALASALLCLRLIQRRRRKTKDRSS